MLGVLEGLRFVVRISLFVMLGVGLISCIIWGSVEGGI